MAFYCQQMFKIALELSRYDQAWDGTATKFLEHFLSIAEAMNAFGSHEVSLWDEEDGFFYDVLVGPDGTAQPMRVRSMVGLLPHPRGHRGAALDHPGGPRRHRAAALAAAPPSRAGRTAAQPLGARGPQDAAVAGGPGAAARGS